jgi:hypothetical protein
MTWRSEKSLETQRRGGRGEKKKRETGVTIAAQPLVRIPSVPLFLCVSKIFD